MLIGACGVQNETAKLETYNPEWVYWLGIYHRLVKAEKVESSRYPDLEIGDHGFCGEVEG